MTDALQVRDVDVALSGRPILTNISMAVARGQLVGLLGPNGAGKTTLMRAIMGLIPVARGRIHVDGTSPIGYVPQRQDVDWAYPMSVEELVRTAFVGRNRGMGPRRRFGHQRAKAAQLEAAFRALRKVGMYEYADRTISDLSGGQKQRVLVARALAPNPAILLLDEPFTGLDHPNQDALSDLFVELAHAGVAILMSTHDLVQAVEICDSLVMLNRTIRATGTPDALRDPHLWMDTFQVRADSALLRALGLVNR